MKKFIRMADTVRGIKRLRKVISKSAKVSTKGSLKDKRATASVKIAENVRATFKDVTLSEGFVAYAKSLLIADAIKDARKNVTDSANSDYVNCCDENGCIFTTEELGLAYSFNKSIANVALHNVQAELRKTTSKVEHELLDAVIDGNFVVLGTDFSGLDGDFLNVLFGKKAINQFNDLVMLLYADNLNKDARNYIENGVQKAFLDVVDNYIYTTEEFEKVDGVEMKSIVSQYYKRYKTSLTEKFLDLEGTAYLVKGEIMESITERYNAYQAEKAETTEKAATSEN